MPAGEDPEADHLRARLGALEKRIKRMFTAATGKPPDTLCDEAIERPMPPAALIINGFLRLNIAERDAYLSAFGPLEGALRQAFDACFDASQSLRASEIGGAAEWLRVAEHWVDIATGIEMAPRPEDAKHARERNAWVHVYEEWLHRQPFERNGATKLAKEMVDHFAATAPVDGPPILKNEQTMMRKFRSWKKGEDLPT